MLETGIPSERRGFFCIILANQDADENKFGLYLKNVLHLLRDYKKT